MTRTGTLCGVRRAFVVLVTGAALAGCTSAAEVSDGAGDAPRVGQCYDTPDSVLPDAGDPTAPVDCAEPHTLETYAVLHLEAPLDKGAIAVADERCVEAMDAFLGGPGFLHTAVSVFYFTPTEAARADGARWVRCDAAVVADTTARSARPVTGSLRDAFAGGVPSRYRRCLGARPDPTRAQPLVPCDLPHVAQLMPAPLDLGGRDTTYPGMDELAARANARCAPVVQSAFEDAGRSLVIVPTRRLWDAGRSTAQCWALAAEGERLNDSEAQPA